ncbi:hypothetical protein QTP70_003845 [Hemibagrus guttatus]|uniref:ribonuclease H n=1 Tax=Hemibagrus guttatus TaxID=175788 RepID=A0AAE0R2G0_9TELE|nr:hypothetical protein QTP70_003845 [Hemibagrus guttatus]
MGDSGRRASSRSNKRVTFPLKHRRITYAGPFRAISPLIIFIDMPTHGHDTGYNPMHRISDELKSLLRVIFLQKQIIISEYLARRSTFQQEPVRSRALRKAPLKLIQLRYQPKIFKLLYIGRTIRHQERNFGTCTLNFIPDWSRPGSTMTAIGAVDLQGAGGNWVTVGRRSRGGRRVRRQREKSKGKGRELADMMERRKVDILCVQETRWKGSKARSIGAGFKLFYYGVDSKRNRVGYELEEKGRFWSELDEVIESIPTGERVVIGEDFNGHVGEGNRGDEEVMGKFGVKERNFEGQMVVDFAKRMEMAVVNTYFQKREEHRVTYKSGGRRTQKKKRQKLRQALGGQVVLPDDWETTAEDSIQRKRLAKKKWDMDRTEENRQEYKELQHRVKREVSKAKQKAYDELYTRLDTREVEKDLYRVLTREESVQRRWKEYFEELMHEENEREKRVEGVNSVEQKVDKIRKDEVRKDLKRMKSGKAVGPDDILVEQYGFMPRKSTTDAIFALRILMEKYWDGQRESHCLFVDLEKAYDRVPREELWYCMRKSGVAEKYVRVVQDMYERSRTVVRCAVGQTEEFKVEVGLHQASALSPFLFAIVMDQLSEEVRQEFPWTMMFADDIVICSESREQVEENLERWRFALERRGMKVSRSKTEYMCVNEREGNGTVRLQGEEVKKIQEFKYLGSTIQSNGECGKEVKKRVQAGKGRELADMMERRKVDILCVQETRWKGSKARSIGAGFKLFYYGVDSKRNGVGVVLKEEFVRNVLEVGCELEEKERFWSELDEVMESIPTGDEEVMGKFGVKERNLEGQMVVDFAKRMDMGVVNTYFQKREEHRVTYKSGGRRTQIEKKTKWWKLKKEECCEEFRQKLRQALGGHVVLPDDWETTAEDSIQRKRLAKKKWDMDRTEENRQEYKELQHRVKREVSKAKQKAYEELYTRVLTSEESVQRRWKEYFEELMDEENEREKRVEGVNSVEQKVDKIRKDEVRKALKRMKSGKAVGPDDIPVEVWKCLGEAAVEFLANLFNRVLENLEKAYDRVPREELWYCMRKSGVAEKYVRVVQDMYERSRTVVRCAVGQTEEFNVEVGLHQGSALSPFLFAIVMDQLSEEVRQESPWTMMFAADIVICSESREQVEENLERWRFALERRGMKVSRSKTEYMCVNEREGSGTVRLQGEEVKKVQEFKYLGSTVQSNGECGKEQMKTSPSVIFRLCISE